MSASAGSVTFHERESIPVDETPLNDYDKYIILFHQDCSSLECGQLKIMLSDKQNRTLFNLYASGRLHVYKPGESYNIVTDLNQRLNLGLGAQLLAFDYETAYFIADTARPKVKAVGIKSVITRVKELLEVSNF